MDKKIWLAALCLLSGAAHLSAQAGEEPPCNPDDAIHTRTFYPRGCVPKKSVTMIGHDVQFANAPLADLATLFNAQHTALRIVIRGRAAQQTLLSGRLDLNDPLSLIEALRRNPALKITREGDAAIVREGK